MHVCKYLNERARALGNRMDYLSKLFQKQKKEKKHMKRFSFITQFKIELLLSFTSCRKVLGKIHVSLSWNNKGHKINTKRVPIEPNIDTSTQQSGTSLHIAKYGLEKFTILC